MVLGSRGIRYKLWLSGKGDGVGGVGAMVEKLYEKVVEVRRVSDRVMAVVLVFEEDMLRLILGYAPQCGRSLEEKQSFYDELKGEWDMHRTGDLVIYLVNLNGHIGRHID